MSKTNYQVVFKSQIATGENTDVVKQKLMALFKMNPKQIDAMFSGKPVYIKKNVDEATAKKYQSAIEKTGAIVEIVGGQAAPERKTNINEQVILPGQAANSHIPDKEAPKTTVALTIPTEFDDLSMAETGSQLQTNSDNQEAPDIPDISHLSLSELESGPLNTKTPDTAIHIDTSSLNLED